MRYLEAERLKVRLNGKCCPITEHPEIMLSKRSGLYPQGYKAQFKDFNLKRERN